MNKDFDTFSDKYSKNKTKNKQKKRNSDRDDFISIISDLFYSINYKVAIFLFILGILIFSDVFIESFLMSINGAVYADQATSKGTVIQLLALTFGYIIIDLLVSGEII